MTFIASYNHYMTQIIAKAPPIHCIFGTGSHFFAHLGTSLQLLVGGLAIVKTLHLAR